MRLSHERLGFGSAMIGQLENLLTQLDPKTSELDLTGTIEYMEHIRGKMIKQYYHQPDSPEILAQITKMNECINTVRELIKKNASPM